MSGVLSGRPNRCSRIEVTPLVPSRPLVASHRPPRPDREHTIDPVEGPAKRA
jgi:hypothetical protein